MSNELLEKATRLDEDAHMKLCQAIRLREQWLESKGWKISREGEYTFYEKEGQTTPNIYAAIKEEKDADKLGRLRVKADFAGSGVIDFAAVQSSEL